MANNDELNEMFEEDKNKEFEEWANREVSFFNNMNDEEKQQLRSDYTRANLWEKAYQDTMNQAIDHANSGIDYSTDISKVGEKMEIASTQLTETLNSFSEKYGNVKNR